MFLFELVWDVPEYVVRRARCTSCTLYVVHVVRRARCTSCTLYVVHVTMKVYVLYPSPVRKADINLRPLSFTDTVFNNVLHVTRLIVALASNIIFNQACKKTADSNDSTVICNHTRVCKLAK